MGSTKECPCSEVREGMFTWIPIILCFTASGLVIDDQVREKR